MNVSTPEVFWVRLCTSLLWVFSRLAVGALGMLGRGSMMDRHWWRWCILVLGDKGIHKALPSCTDLLLKRVYYASASFALKAKEKDGDFQWSNWTVQLHSKLRSSNPLWSGSSLAVYSLWSAVLLLKWSRAVWQVAHTYPCLIQKLC